MLVLLSLALAHADAANVHTNDMRVVVQSLQTDHGAAIAVLTSNSGLQKTVSTMIGASDQYRLVYAGSASEGNAVLKKESLTCGLFVARAQLNYWDVTPVGQCPALKVPAPTVRPIEPQERVVCTDARTSTDPTQAVETFMNEQIGAGRDHFLSTSTSVCAW